MNPVTEVERMDIYNLVIGKTLDFGFCDWLYTHGFFKAPASRKFHEAHEGGLFDHSYAVTKALLDLTKNNGLKWKREISPYIVGMFHDLCKIDLYVPIDGGGWEHNNNLLYPRLS